MTQAHEAWYKHLDECQQCEEHPFELCAVGVKLIALAILERDTNMLKNCLASVEKCKS